MKKKSSKGRKVIKEAAEELSYCEKDNIIEELSFKEEERNCISEGDMLDDKNILSRVKLF